MALHRRVQLTWPGGSSLAYVPLLSFLLWETKGPRLRAFRWWSQPDSNRRPPGCDPLTFAARNRMVGPFFAPRPGGPNTFPNSLRRVRR